MVSLARDSRVWHSRAESSSTRTRGFYKDIIKKAYTKESEMKTKELLQLSSAIREAAVMDEETEMLMDAYDGFDSDSEEWRVGIILALYSLLN